VGPTKNLEKGKRKINAHGRKPGGQKSQPNFGSTTKKAQGAPETRELSDGTWVYCVYRKRKCTGGLQKETFPKKS